MESISRPSYHARSTNQDFGNHETIHKRASGRLRPATNLDSGRLFLPGSNRQPMSLHAGLCCEPVSSNLKGGTKQFGWLQAVATKRSLLSAISWNQPTEFYYFRRSFDLISRLPKSYNGC
jgi:hypothetical protein